MRKSEKGTGSRLLRAGIAVAATAAVVVAATATPASAAVAVTLSATAGPTATITKTTASSTTNFLTGVTAPSVNFSIPACPLLYNSTAVTTPTATTGNITGSTINKIANNKALITVPVGVILVPGTSITKWNVCIYSGVAASSALLANSTFTVAGAIGLTNITPDSGPSLGGNLIQVTGSGLPLTNAGYLSASLGGIPLTGITAVSAVSFTAIAPAHGPGAATLSVTTASGTKTLAGQYSYSNGITVTPNTAPAETSTVAAPAYVDIMGAGFLDLDFARGVGPSKVWLVDGVYEPAASGTTYTNGPVAECVLSLVVSDSEIICTLNLLTGAFTPATGVIAGTKVPDGAYTVTVVGDSRAGQSGNINYSKTELSSGSTFTVAPY